MSITLTDSNFEREVTQNEGVFLVDFWASWCGPCQMMAPLVEQLAIETEGKFKVGKLEVDQNPNTASRFNILSIPAFIIFKKGQEIYRFMGARSKQALKEEVEKYL
ncbi:thioredoxin [candidate division WWE3 bacterium CG08_land_8_20_14_0_20_43_13]|uniref:Thioredoxin n=1 Tax=candidate division WWE3 bacterium CG08_land_8_20_14_0_20_43_13 TaxID=1975087 RepID=A0A2H0X8A4_UNCKA|nr:MAG: thioredoxin [candidate division WWE3 bacterium CG08_land_8_20_14_0_20_43_13]